MNAVTFLYATAPNEAIAEKIAHLLVESGAAACVNIIPGVKSIYRWEGRIDAGNEIVLIVKTTASQAATARDLIISAHPFETPAIAAISINENHSSKSFCDWIRNP